MIRWIMYLPIFIDIYELEVLQSGTDDKKIGTDPRSLPVRSG